MSYWTSIDNRRKFLEKLKIKFNIRKPSDWGNVKIQDVRDAGGSSLLSYYYNSSLFTCLRSIYKGFKLHHIEFINTEIEWKEEWFPARQVVPMSYWYSIENRRKFLDEMKLKLKIKLHSDWGKIPSHRLSAYGGGYLLKFYDMSMKKLLRGVYPEINWKNEWFIYAPKFTKKYWNSLENQRNFLDKIRTQFSITALTDWRRVSLTLIQKKGGKVLVFAIPCNLKGLLHKYNGSIISALEAVYSESKFLKWGDFFVPKLAQTSVLNSVFKFVK